MSGSLQRALGLWVAGQVSGLHVYADDLANTQYQYPACVVSQLLRSYSPLGCGPRDHTLRTPSTGWVTASGRVHREETSFRLTLQAPHSSSNSGAAVVDALLTSLEEAVLAVQSSRSGTVLTDTQVTPARTYHLELLRMEGRQPVPTDTTGEPFLFRGSLGIRTVRLVPVDQVVDGVMKRIRVNDGGEPT